MNVKSILTPEYKQWLAEIKNKVRSAQLKAATVVNSALIEFYWELGKMIVEKQEQTAWGDKVINQLSKDLQKEFTDIKGLSRSNLYYTKQFYLFYKEHNGQQPVDSLFHLSGGKIVQQPVGQFVQQLVAQIPWGHNILIFSKSQTIDAARFYLAQTIENGWSRDTLALQIKSRLFERVGKGVTNFALTLPSPQSDLAAQTIKDPYMFDFLTMTKPYHEKDIENQLIAHMTKFLLEHPFSTRICRQIEFLSFSS
jgi:predicted nuclease of restriction endonuclease-like (RecB) superfamily